MEYDNKVIDDLQRIIEELSIAIQYITISVREHDGSYIEKALINIVKALGYLSDYVED